MAESFQSIRRGSSPGRYSRKARSSWLFCAENAALSRSPNPSRPETGYSVEGSTTSEGSSAPPVLMVSVVAKNGSEKESTTPRNVCSPVARGVIA